MRDPVYMEAGCDEAGRGCLAGPVFAAAVILPPDYRHPLLNDSKQLSAAQRAILRDDIERRATAWAVAALDPEEIDRLNILWASIEAMHRALERLDQTPASILADGNRFKPFRNIPHRCIVKGDATHSAIAAASILAKTHRDAFMQSIHADYPYYGWDVNKGYPTAAHREAICIHGVSIWHRQSFRLFPDERQYKLFD